MPLGIPDTKAFPWDVSLKHHLGQLMDLTQGGLITFADRPTMGVDGTTLGTNHKGYTIVNTTTANIEQWDGTSWKVLIDSARVVRTPSIDFYINATTGNDNNTGLSADSPLKTIPKLLTELSTFNFLDAIVNIYLGAGTYVNFSLPLNTAYLRVNIIGAGSAQVNLGAFTIANDQKVSISKLTISQPGYATEPSIIVLAGPGSILHIGPDITLGDCGIGAMYFGGRDSSTIFVYPNCPIKVTGNCYRIFTITSGSLVFRHYLADPWDKVPVPTAIPPLSSADNLCNVEFVGTLRTLADTYIFLQRGASIYGEQYQGSCEFTGNVSNALAYLGISNVTWIMNTVVGAVGTAKSTLGFPSTATPGSLDATTSSYVSGTVATRAI